MFFRKKKSKNRSKIGLLKEEDLIKDKLDNLLDAIISSDCEVYRKQRGNESKKIGYVLYVLQQ